MCFALSNVKLRRINLLVLPELDHSKTKSIFIGDFLYRRVREVSDHKGGKGVIRCSDHHYIP